MMVGVAVGLIATTVVMHTYSSSEMYRRNLTGTGDAVQAASIAAQRLDLALQGAGASLSRSTRVWGCRLLVTYAGNAVLPRSSAFPAPFDSMPQTLRAVPVVVQNGGTSSSDVILTMGGDSGSANQPLSVSSPSGNSLVASPTPPIGIGLNSGASASEFDLFLVAPQDVGGGPGDCRIVQVASTFAPQTLVTDATVSQKVAQIADIPIPLNASTYGNVDSSILNKSPAAFHLGLRADPNFSMVGVNENRELVVYDVLNRFSPQVIGENVFLMKVRYGLDNGANGGTINDNAVDDWVSPGESGWTITELMDGKAATQQKIGFIKAIRIAIVLRSSQAVNSDAVVSSIDMFQDLAASRRFSYALSSDEKRYQYQVYEWVIPLRNMRVPPII
ncbi:PilW family protein [Zoogloea sp.]|uniref:PilW family protein n=1 Tax=Zoogloea sp. TaxID=49181 RepID=UPI0031FC8965